LELIWYSTINILLKEGEEWKVEPGALRIKTLLIFGDCSVVDQSVVVEEQSTGDVESNKHINAVVLVSCKDEKDTKAVAEPGEGMEEEDPPGGVLSDEEVEEGEGDSVAREHVVTTSPHTLQTKTCT